MTTTNIINSPRPFALNIGGTGAALTASNGGIFYSNASTGAILAGTATANQALLSGASSAPSWSTATYPATTTINQILYSTANNTIGAITAVNNGTLISSATGVPSFLANGTTGQVLIATTGAPPSWGTDSSAGGGLKSVTVTLTQSDIQNMYATPVLILAAPGAGLVNVVSHQTAYLNFQTSAFVTGAGATARTQYSNTVHGAGTATGIGLTQTFMQSTNSVITTGAITLGTTTTGITNQAIYISNTVQANTGGNAASTLVITLIYYTVTATV